MAYLGQTRINIGDTGSTSLVTSENPLPCEISQATGFGEVLTGQLTPFVQASGQYNLLPANIFSYISGTGSATVTNQEFTCATGTGVGAYGVIRSARSVNYKGGMAAEFRGTGRFTAGVADSLQGVGLFNVGDSLLFGYYGTSFGIIHQHGGKPELRVLTITAPSSGSTLASVTINGTLYSIPLTAGTVAHNAYEIATYLTANQTVFSCTQNGATVSCIATTDGEKAGSYAFSHATATGTWARTTAGVTKTTDFVAKASWNRDTASFLTDVTKGNVYRIIYQYLGYGAIYFFVERPSTGKFVLVHQIEDANANTTPSLGNPSLHVGVFAASLGSTTNLTTRSACFSSFIEGTPGRTRNPRAYTNSKSISSTLIHDRREARRLIRGMRKDCTISGRNPLRGWMLSLGRPA